MRLSETSRRTAGAVLAFTLVAGPVKAGPFFFDDFSDGDARDGSPVTWFWDDALGTFDVTNEGLSITPPSSAWAVVLDDQLNGANYVGPLTVTTQLRKAGGALFFGGGVFVRNVGDNLSYSAGIIGADVLFITRNEGPGETNLGTTFAGFDTSVQEIVIRLDVIDGFILRGGRGAPDMPASRLELRAWAPGEPMPADPLLAVLDAAYPTDGEVGIFALLPTTFRSVEVVPEPTTLSLVALGGIAVVRRLRRRAGTA